MKTILLPIVLFVSIQGYGQIKLAIKDTIPRWTIRNSLETVKITYEKDTMSRSTKSTSKATMPSRMTPNYTG